MKRSNAPFEMAPVIALLLWCDSLPPEDTLDDPAILSIQLLSKVIKARELTFDRMALSAVPASVGSGQ